MSAAENDVQPFALAVDDEPIILEIASEMLVDAGFRPLHASNVVDAIGQLESHSDAVALLFTDIQLPGVRNGISLAREAAKRWPSIKIIVASGSCRPKASELPEGAVFIGKPFSADIVYEQLHRLLPDGEKPEPLRRLALR
jgi:DNA-binding NtrC family response regulator